MEDSASSPRTLEAALIAAAMLLWIAPAHAYLDPATGSIILQGLIAGVAGFFVVVRLYWAHVKAFFRKHKAGAKQSP
jgi:hypothetical protein